MIARRRALALFLSLLLCVASIGAKCEAQQPAAASITIDAGKVEGNISPALYGQFDEFMFEGVKGGLHAEVIRDRSFEEPPNVIGLPRYWERYPDDRNDDYAFSFRWDDSVFYPAPKRVDRAAMQH